MSQITQTKTFEDFMDVVAKANGDHSKLKMILEPVYLDHLRLQHLDDVKNDILPFDKPGGNAHPTVDAAWLLRTSNFEADLRTMIDDDIAYWDAQ